MYHWPKEMIEPVKILRQTIIDSGIDTNTHYIRIWPEEKDGQWKIRADTKEKVGTSKFTIKARWSVPPMDPTLRNANKDWAKPTWVKSVTHTAPLGRRVENSSSVDFASNDFTGIINPL